MQDGDLYIHISRPVTDDCCNDATYGEICVLCDECGRWREGEDDPR